MAAVAYSCLPPHDAYPFCNTSLPEVARLDDLVGRLSVAEMVGQMFMDAQLAYGNTTYPNSSHGDLSSTGVPRLGIAQFSYAGQGNLYRGASNGCNLNCCTGGKPPCIVDSPGTSVFPQGTGLAAAFDSELAFQVGTTIADESRAMQRHNPNRTVEYRSGASSVINIARDPRWGRVPETYGECPTLTGKLAVAFNKGLMGFATASAREPPPVLRTLPVLRHFIAYAGPESKRFSFNARVNELDLQLTYLPAWRRMVREKAIAGVMSAISALNGVPGIAHASLLSRVLRDEWGFDGFVLSDCDTFPSLRSVWAWGGSDEEAAASALLAGNEINCGPGFQALLNASQQGLVSKASLMTAARRILRYRMRVGDLQPPQTDPWWANAPPLSVVGSAAHVALVERVVADGAVLLHHKPGTLPLTLPARAVAEEAAEEAAEVAAVAAAEAAVEAAEEAAVAPTAPTASKGVAASLPPTGAEAVTAKLAAIEASASASYTIALIGPSADDPTIQAHTYHGTPQEWVTLRAALASELGGRAALKYARGCAIDSDDTSGFGEALGVAADADAVVYAGGLYSFLEEEDTDRMHTLGLPGVQSPLIAALRNVTAARGVPLIALLMSGGPISIPELVPPATTALDAVLWTSYYGQTARPLARILLGDGVLPTGRLPWTVPVDNTSLPPIDDYDMTTAPGRTYRYLDTHAAPPLFPFGFGLPLGEPWLLSPLHVTPPRLTLSALRAAAAEPCTLTTGAGLVVTLSLTRPPSRRPHDPADEAPLGHSVLLFGASETRSGSLSPYPRQQLLDVAKPRLMPGDEAALTMRVCAAELLDEGLGLHRQPLPNTLRLWVGDAATAEQLAEIPIDLDHFEDACD